VLSDEVYEHMVYDGQQHESVCRHPVLAERAFVVSSFRQDLSRDRLEGRLRGRAGRLTAEFRKVHQYNVFTVNTPMQHGLAATWRSGALSRSAGLLPAQARPVPRRPGGHPLQLLPADGTYFQCVATSAISDLPEAEFAQWLTREIKVAAIPVSAFYSQGKESGIVRFCFAKQDATLRQPGGHAERQAAEPGRPLLRAGLGAQLPQIHPAGPGDAQPA
jgi:methionine aminotransferase